MTVAPPTAPGPAVAAPGPRPADGSPPARGPAADGSPCSVADLLRRAAAERPEVDAVLTPRGRAGDPTRTYDALTFAELDAAADRFAAALASRGVRRGERVALMVRPGGRFAVAVFGTLRAGAAAVLIDPGLGVPAVLRCLREVSPTGFVGEPIAVAAARAVGRLDGVKAWVSAGRAVPGAIGWERFGTLGPSDFSPPAMGRTDPAAVIFTSGSTGLAKGVAYEHGMFLAQIEHLRAGYDLPPGEVDVPAFPLFALFDVGLSATMIVPRMHPSRPAHVRPEEILGPIRERSATRAFGSPALWKKVLKDAADRGVTLPSVTALLSAGAPIPPRTHEWARAVLPAGAQLHTPYGATEALPVCTTGTDEILGETAARTREGAGTCVGQPFPGVSLRVVAEVQGPIDSIDEATDLPTGEIGEVIVSGPAVTREYVNRPEQTRRAKIADPAAPTGVWHRMGDVGYLDDRGRLWFCGRQAHVVRTTDGPIYPVRGEAVLNELPAVRRTAIVGVGDPGRQRPVIVVECEPGARTAALREELRERAAASPVIGPPRAVLFRKTLPTDVRHNTKIDRAALADWATRLLASPLRRRLARA
ncbi:fatty acid CoA ligase family protein [Alienimonas californiensis]|uniref:Long-chain-fatty-acid--CoA ligase n=1 Tax=Alienimonas californiensis TaxID=2527989 RepID=A0A517PDP4_9PLAN|nr:fatty acid CoA ligase family protein [Alienimonas californiensis]QDT17497.1 Long-chain-fatty-acid--CoA ligase [Alienimonas californiensis]